MAHSAPMKPLVSLQLITENLCNINCVGFIFPVVLSHASQNPPQGAHANVDFINLVLNKLKKSPHASNQDYNTV